MGLWLPRQLRFGFVLSCEVNSLGSKDVGSSPLSFHLPACDSRAGKDSDVVTCDAPSSGCIEVRAWGAPLCEAQPACPPPPPGPREHGCPWSAPSCAGAARTLVSALGQHVPGSLLVCTLCQDLVCWAPSLISSTSACSRPSFLQTSLSFSFMLSAFSVQYLASVFLSSTDWIFHFPCSGTSGSHSGARSFLCLWSAAAVPPWPPADTRVSLAGVPPPPPVCSYGSFLHWAANLRSLDLLSCIGI